LQKKLDHVIFIES